VPIIVASELTDEQQKEFIIKDNVGFGSGIGSSWRTNGKLSSYRDWGLDLPIIMEEPSMEELIGEEKNKPATMKITFTSPEQLQKAEIDIQEILDRKYKGAYFSVSAGEI
jgi:hypothetical protein